MTNDTPAEGHPENDLPIHDHPLDDDPRFVELLTKVSDTAEDFLNLTFDLHNSMPAELREMGLRLKRGEAADGEGVEALKSYFKTDSIVEAIMSMVRMIDDSMKIAHDRDEAQEAYIKAQGEFNEYARGIVAKGHKVPTTRIAAMGTVFGITEKRDPADAPPADASTRDAARSEGEDLLAPAYDDHQDH